jgi:hypothetical protein
MGDNQLHRRVIQLALDLAQPAELAKLSDSEALEKVVSGLVALMVASKVMPGTERHAAVWRLTRDKNIQSDLLQFVKAVAAGEPATVTFTDLTLSTPTRRRGRHQVTVATGSPRDVLFYAFVRALETVRPGRIQECGRPDCKRLFLKVTKKNYCTPRCQIREYMRGWRAKHYTKNKRGGNNAQTTRPRRRVSSRTE